LTAKVKIVGKVKGSPSGIVTFTSGSTILGTAQLRRGSAVLVIAALPEGDDPIVASYSGSAKLKPSESAVRIETVEADRVEIHAP
jgi:hypothetical protein